MSSDAPYPGNPDSDQELHANAPNLPATTPAVQEEENDQEIETPRDTDVLCGRGGKALRHPGNQTYRRLVTLNKGIYTTCLKSEKLKISKSIVAAVREQKGRFLEKNMKTNKWFDIGDKKAVEKTSQALREGQPKTRQKIQELGGGAAGAQALLEKQLAEERMQEQTRLSASGVLGISGDVMQAAAMSGGSLGSAGQQPPNNFGDMNFGSMDPETLAGFPPADVQRMGGRFLQPMSDSLSQLPHERQLSLSDINAAGDQLDAPPLGPIGTRDVSMELFKLSLSEGALGQDNKKPPVQPLPPTQEHQEGDDTMVPPAALRLRPSLTKKGSAVREELGMVTAQTSSMSLMSDFSGFGESTMSLGDETKRIDSLVREFGTTPMSSLSPRNSLEPGASSAQSPGGSFGRMDRRKLFAKMKANRPPSEVSDGMPDFHPVESAHSVFSNMSMVGDEDGAKRDFQIPSTSSSRVMAGDLIVGSRRSLMSGNSIISDLSKKIGNVSTRSIPMDDMSFTDGAADDGGGGADLSERKSPSAPLQKPSLTMDFE